MDRSVTPEGSKPTYGVIKELDQRVPMRDGVTLACDVFRPDGEGQFPALLAFGPYGKEGQSAQIPPRMFSGDYAHIEAGDTEYFVSRGYVHVIADVRGTGHSEGKYDICSLAEQQDGYDLVEWIAAQPWCNGNVGMVGVSYYAFIQYLVAAQQPPHLKAIFPHDGWTDMYRDVSHHGGILMHGWLRIWVEGGNILAWDNSPASERLMPPELLGQRVQDLLDDPVIQECPTIYNALIFPRYKPTLYDWVVQDLDGPYYWERSAYTKLDRIKIPAFLGSEMHNYPVVMHLPGSFGAYEGVDAPKKLVIRPSVPERPFHELHDEIVRWYDHWLKGIDTGVMDGPSIQIWVHGRDEWRNGEQWPLPETKWAEYFLSTGKLQEGSAPVEAQTPETFHHRPVLPLIMNSFPLDPPPEFLSYSTGPLEKDVEVVGPVVLYLYAALSGEDADFIVKLKDVGPEGTQTVLSRGWLKASHRTIDQERSRPWQPFHPHTEAVPVIPGEVNEYVIEVRPIANLFKKGHEIVLEVRSCDYPMEPLDLTLLWPLWSHLSYSKEVDYEIHHSPEYPSRLVLPVMPKD
jgi:predicted acyl esterase